MPNRVKTCLSGKISSHPFFLIIGFTVFCGISQLSRLHYPLFGLVVIVGITFPLTWGGFTKTGKQLVFPGRIRERHYFGAFVPAS